MFNYDLQRNIIYEYTYAQWLQVLTTKQHREYVRRYHQLPQEYVCPSLPS
jgi:hypothetical protein